MHTSRLSLTQILVLIAIYQHHHHLLLHHHHLLNPTLASVLSRKPSWLTMWASTPSPSMNQRLIIQVRYYTLHVYCKHGSSHPHKIPTPNPVRISIQLHLLQIKQPTV